MEQWSDGVMEQWSDGVLKRLRFQCSGSRFQILVFFYLTPET